MTNQKKMMHWGNFKYFKKTSYKNFYSKIDLHVKLFLGNGLVVLFQSNPFGS
jgi:hypothetical protein